MPKSSAYTLIEILIVMSIIGLLMGIGILQYRDYARRQALTSAARSLVGTLRLLQEYSLSGRKPTGVTCDNLDGYRIIFSPSLKKYSTYAICDHALKDEKNVPYESVDIECSPPASNDKEFMFKVLGQGTDLPGDFVITVTQVSTGNFQTITVSPTGKITWP